MKRGALAVVVVSALARDGAAQGRPAATLHVDHTPPACMLADKAPGLLACLEPRSARADVRVLFRADDGPWYATAFRYEMPCFRGALPRPSAGTPRVSYVIEAQGAGVTARSPEYEVLVVSAAGECPGPIAPIASGPRASPEAPASAPKIPPGFEGTRVRAASPGPRAQPSARAATPVQAPASTESPRPPDVRPASAPSQSGGGHAWRNAAILVGGVAAAGGTAVAIRAREASDAPPVTIGSGLPATGVAGTYVGTETVTYSASCSGTDDIVLNLQQSASMLSGVMTFTVRSCPCCSAGRGANPVSGFLSDTRVELTTPIGFAYSGTFAGNRLSGSLVAPVGITGTWTVDKR